MMQRLRFLILAWRAFNLARQKSAPVYMAATVANVPVIAIYVALDRQAWRISNIAMEAFHV